MVRDGAGRNPVPRGASPHFSPSAQEAQLTVRKAVIPVAGFGTRFLPDREVGPLGLTNRRYPTGFLAQMRTPFMRGLEGG